MEENHGLTMKLSSSIVALFCLATGFTVAQGPESVAPPLGAGVPEPQAAEPVVVQERAGGTGLSMMPKNVANPSIDAISDAQFEKLRRAASEKPVYSKPIPLRENPYSLLSLSSFVENAGSSVILPKGCVVFCPPEFESRVVKTPTMELSDWQTFLAANRNWIRCIEVTEEQIQGRAKIPEESLLTYKKAKLLVIATLRGSPVTVLNPNPKP